MAVVKDEAYSYILLDDATGLPRFWGSAWAIQKRGARWKPNSILAKLRNVDLLYRFSDARFCWSYLDDAIAARDAEVLFRLLELFQSHLTSMNEYRHAEVSAWDDAVQFILHFGTPLAISDAKWRRSIDAIRSLGRLKSPIGGEIPYARALPPETLKGFLSLFQVQLSNQSMKSLALNLRNRLIVALLLSVGLRRGEMLMLTISSLVRRIDRTTGETRNWLNVRFVEDSDEDSEKRYSTPALKTHFSTRQVPVSEDLAALYKAYVMHGRSGATNQTLVLSQNGRPLSAEGLNWLFREWSKSLSKEATDALADVSGGRKSVRPHDLRHTCATHQYEYFRTKNQDISLTYQKMRRFFGWSPKSDMPQVYADAAIQEEVHQTIALVTELRIA